MLEGLFIFVVPGLVPGIHAFLHLKQSGLLHRVFGGVTPGHDGKLLIFLAKIYVHTVALKREAKAAD